MEEAGPASPAKPDAAFTDRLAGLGGGILVEAIRRDPLGPARRVLEHVAWVPDLAALLELQPHLPAGWSAVTRDGVALAGPIAIALGRAEGPLERRAELDRLELELTGVEAEVAERERARAEADTAASDARLALDAARAREGEAAAARRAADEAERAAGRAAENVAREAAWQVSQAERAEAEAGRLRAAVAGLEAAAADQSAGLDAVVAGQEDRSALEVWEARAADLRARRDRVAAQLATAEAARRDAEALVARAVAAAAYDEGRIARAETDERALAERETAAVAEREQVAVEVAAAAAREATALAVLEELRSADAADREQLRSAESAASGARERLRAADDRVRSAEVAALEARLGLDAIREQVLVELAGIGSVGVRALRAAALDLPEALRAAGTTDESIEAATDGPEGDVESAELEAILPYVVPAWEAARPTVDPPTPGRLASLRRRFHELGAANPFAVDEYAELRARVESLEGQGTDLREAITRTRTLIDELSTLIADQFQATFRALESAFDARFKQLFGGGFARLELTDPGDLASTGVEIVARPPGKKAQALAMLSGGERALTAVALLFAMLEVRPVPFCVLDEVDAALDEANVGRFSEALRSLAAATQFIVITHNRGTIEMADALYGVTVGDDSVSRVISLRLDEATAIAAAAGGNGAGALDPVGARRAYVLAAPIQGRQPRRPRARPTRARRRGRRPRTCRPAGSRTRPTSTPARDPTASSHAGPPTKRSPTRTRRRRPTRRRRARSRPPRPSRHPRTPRRATWWPVSRRAAAGSSAGCGAISAAGRVGRRGTRSRRRSLPATSARRWPSSSWSGPGPAATCRPPRPPSGPSWPPSWFRASPVSGDHARPVPVCPPSSSSSASTGPARRPRSASWPAATGRGLHRPARCRGHVPRRRDRAARDLGGALRGPDRGARARRRPRRGRVRFARRRRGARTGPGHRRHRRPAAHQGQPDGRALEDPPDHRPSSARHRPEVLFVLDATTGQNGLAQARAFHEAVGLTGVVLTKLDSTSKGGIVFAIEDALKIPVRFVGVGEKVGDLLPFDPDAFVAALFA